MSEIKYLIKPEWISWDCVQECQYKSHEKNRQKGLFMHCQELTGTELKDNIGNGVCFVALDSNKVVATCSMKIIGKSKRWAWWNKKDRCAYYCMDAVLPEYQGKHIYSGLQRMRNEYVISHGIDVIEIDTAENNDTMLLVLKKQGFQKVSLSAYPNTNYYSVILAKWINNRPYTKISCLLRYHLARLITKTIWKKGRIVRFPFNKL